MLMILCRGWLLYHASVYQQNLSPGLLQTGILEAIAAAELCGCSFELIIIADNYGVFSYVVRTLSGTLGGVIVFQYIYLLWSIELTETHVGRAHGALVEGISTMLCRCSSKFLSDKQPQYSSVIDSFIATFLVVASFNYSGGYLNPVLATSLKYGCRGHPLMEHICVYWIGSSLGAFASLYVYPLVFNYTTKAKEE
ncbi:AQPN [Lepeophtheirus salmonis]|uniref:AQPN n=1 Tax=Lepeophtheirus salmonis TaxID=72036 RepID=A0A7R8H7W1_LEPSM|nr:AQPN [Lepeophtheirus salmonis]CAF2918425.1 AQPN [Lepeophtheirus salmonis]